MFSSDECLAVVVVLLNDDGLVNTSGGCRIEVFDGGGEVRDLGILDKFPVGVVTDREEGRLVNVLVEPGLGWLGLTCFSSCLLPLCRRDCESPRGGKEADNVSESNDDAVLGDCDDNEDAVIVAGTVGCVIGIDDEDFTSAVDTEEVAREVVCNVAEGIASIFVVRLVTASVNLVSWAMIVR